MQVQQQADAGMQEIAARFAQVPPGSAGVEVEAGLALHIGRLASAAEKMARVSDQVPWTEVHPFNLPNPKQLVPAAGVVTLADNSWGPRDGMVWDVRRVTVQGLAGPVAAGAALVVTSTATGAIAAGAGSAALANGTSVTGFTLSFSAAPSTTGTAVLSNVTGGPYTFNIPSGQTSPYTVTFPGPITATSAGVAPTLTIAGLGTGAGNIELYGTGTIAGAAAVAADVVTIYKGSVAGAVSAIPTNAIDNVTGSGAGADLLITQKGAFLLNAGDILVVSGSGLAAANVAVSASGIEVTVRALPWYLK